MPVKLYYDEDGFLIWNPTFRTAEKIESSDFNKRLKLLRVSSSNFIRKKCVRDYIFNRDQNRCKNCGTDSMSHIDHIKSVYYAATYPEFIPFLNKKENLQLLCISCNSKKAPL